MVLSIDPFILLGLILVSTSVNLSLVFRFVIKILTLKLNTK